MIDLNDAVRLLQAKRKELADELDAVDRALAALSRGGADKGSGVPGKNPAPPRETAPPERVPGAVIATKLKPRRTLSDEHKRSLSEGRRKARHSRAAAAGLARELLDQAPALGGSSEGVQQPRLVKRTK